MNKIQIINDDITTLEVDAIVNAANSSLLGGGGVDGAIHRAAGPELLRACQALDGCETGEAKITPGFQLKAQYVIHTVGPVWHGGDYREQDRLTDCYENSMRLAAEYDCQTIAFPAISCGVYGFPIRLAAEIAIDTVSRSLKRLPSIQKVYLVCFDQGVFDIYQSVCEEYQAAHHAIKGSAWERQEHEPKEKAKLNQQQFQFKAEEEKPKVKKEKEKKRRSGGLFGRL